MEKTYKLSNIISYIQGNIRYKLYYSKHKNFIRKHILEQIDARIESMDKLCYFKGSCKICGCSTTALQMANKACPKPCYPTMLEKKEWEEINDEYVVEDKKTGIYWSFNGKTFKQRTNVEG